MVGGCVGNPSFAFTMVVETSTSDERSKEWCLLRPLCPSFLELDPFWSFFSLPFLLLSFRLVWLMRACPVFLLLLWP